MGTVPSRVIDLGDYRLGGTGPGGPPPAPPAPAWLSRRLSRRHRVAGAGLAIAAALAVGGGAAPAPPALEPVWTVPDTAELWEDGGDFRVGGQHLYVVAPAEPGWAVTAYRLADGGVVWRRQHATRTHLVVHPDALFRSEPNRVTAYDPDTGVTRWVRSGMLTRVNGPEALVRRDWPSGLSEIVALNVASGEATARVRIDPAELIEHWWRPAAGGSYVFTVREDGTLSRYDLTEPDAEPRRVRDEVLHGALRAGSPPRVANGVLVVSDGSTDPSRTAAFDPATLARRWTITGADRARPCGPVLCLWTESGGTPDRVRGVRARTGAVMWSLDCGQVSGRSDCHLSIAARGPASGLLVSAWHHDSTADPQRVAWVVDPRSGRRLGDQITGWRWWHTGPYGLLLTRYEPAGVDQVPTRVWFAVTEDRLTRVDVLGSVAGDDVGCRPAGRHLVCQQHERDLEVWRIRR